VITQKVIKVSAGSFTIDFFSLALRPKADYGLLILEVLDHTQRLTRVRLTPMDECTARRRDLYLTTHDTHKRQISRPLGGIRTQHLSRQAVADLRLRQRSHSDRLIIETGH